MSTNKLIAGILAGATAGVVIGYLMNPERTKRKANQLSSKGNDFVEEIKSKFDDFLENISGTVEAAEDEKDELFATGKSKIHQVKREVKSALDGQSM